MRLGRTMALEGAYGLVGKPAPPFVVVPAIKVTADNIVDAYRQSSGDRPTNRSHASPRRGACCSGGSCDSGAGG